MNSRIELANALGEDISAPTQDGNPDPQQGLANPAAKVGDPDSRGEDKLTLPEGITVQQLLEHPELSKQLKSWADGEAAKQLQGKTESLRRQLRAELEPQLTQVIRDQELQQHLESLDEDELASLLARDPKVAAAYGRLQAQKDAQSQSGDDAAALVNGMAVTIATWNRMLEQSDLSAEQKAALKPEVALDVSKGPIGLTEWTVKVQGALIEAESEKRLQKTLDERWNSLREERLAKLDEENPRGAILSGGRQTSTLPDVMEHSGAYLLEEALSRKR